MRQEELEQASADLAAAEQSGDSQLFESAELRVSLAERWVSGLLEVAAAEKKLYERIAERFQIALEQADLAPDEGFQRSPQEDSGRDFVETIQRWDQVDQAEQEASLARQRVDALQTEIKILEDRLRSIRRSAD